MLLDSGLLMETPDGSAIRSSSDGYRNNTPSIRLHANLLVTNFRQLVCRYLLALMLSRVNDSFARTYKLL